MATNFEFYKDEILTFAIADIAVTKDGKMQACCSTDCDNCIFYADENQCLEPEEIKKFFYSEHTEPPKLTKRERAFCEAVQTGWIARNPGALHYFETKPIRREGFWDVADKIEEYYELPPVISRMFSFIGFKDEKPWYVADLLKLEVMEEVHHETD